MTDITSKTPLKLNYPAPQAPGRGVASLSKESALLENRAIHCCWSRTGEGLSALCIENLHTAQVINLEEGFLPKLVLESGCIIDLCDCPLTIGVEVTIENIVKKNDINGTTLKEHTMTQLDSNDTDRNERAK